MKRKQFTLFVAIPVVVLIVVLGILAFNGNNVRDDEKLQIVATFYPLAYIAGEIGGEEVQVKSLVPQNAEVHSWQPSVSDILAADQADVILYNGAGLDLWFQEDILPSLKTSDKVIVETTEGVELMESEHDEHDKHDEQDHGEHDPHTWLSPYVASQQAENIFTALSKADPDNEGKYRDRLDALKTGLGELDSQYLSLSKGVHKDIFVTHAAFGYLTNRYGFHQHGVIGISAEEQPSISTIEALVDEMEEHGVFVVYVDPVYSEDYAQTLKGTLQERSGKEVQILKLYFMLGPQDGKDYIEQLEANLNNLKIGLEA